MYCGVSISVHRERVTLGHSGVDVRYSTKRRWRGAIVRGGRINISRHQHSKFENTPCTDVSKYLGGFVEAEQSDVHQT